jgi:hypothetical protein
MEIAIGVGQGGGDKKLAGHQGYFQSKRTILSVC